jgi:hypothetical protein
MIDSEEHLAAVWVTRQDMDLLCHALEAFRPQVEGERVNKIDRLIKELREAEFGPPSLRRQ